MESKGEPKHVLACSSLLAHSVFSSMSSGDFVFVFYCATTFGIKVSPGATASQHYAACFCRRFIRIFVKRADKKKMFLNNTTLISQ